MRHMICYLRFDDIYMRNDKIYDLLDAIYLYLEVERNTVRCLRFIDI